MNKKIIISLSVIAIVAAIVVGGTIAYFSDTEVSQGNIFTAGSIDLKIDHTRQTYNGVDCMTCEVEIVSDTSNQVVATMGGSDPVEMPHDAFLAWEHSVWIAPPDGAYWIWATYPTLEEDANKTVEYHFENTFDWYGPVSEAEVEFAIASDNSVEVFLNDNSIGGYAGEQGYAQLTYLIIDPNYVNQGENVVRFEVTNWAPTWNASTYQYDNPGGLAYKLTIEGDCESTYFRKHCQLWNYRDLTDEKFFNFDDIKPGDWGTNVISYHVYDNDAHVCMIVDNIVDEGLASGIDFLIWNDENANGELDGEEQVMFGPAPLTELSSYYLGIAEGSDDNYVGVYWCAGTLTVDPITCNGVTMGNTYQGTSMLADLIFYAIQERHVSAPDCGDVDWEAELIQE